MKIDIDSSPLEFARLIGGNLPQGKMMRAQLIHAGQYNKDTAEVDKSIWEVCAAVALAETATEKPKTVLPS